MYYFCFHFQVIMLYELMFYILQDDVLIIMFLLQKQLYKHRCLSVCLSVCL